ncbi:hypothetical protein GGF46_001190 [Coemansia sp. RSA 552]|nr:hypothetical protein GGF46_001190 [Coemansia sp. RSA 552]
MAARPKKTQAFLDFGQKPLLPEPCKECGMAYQPGREEDEQLHRVYHRAWRKRQQQTLVWDIGALSTTGTAKSVEYPSRLRAEDGGRIAAIHTVDPHTASRRQVQRALEVLNHVNEQLGACLLSLSDLSQQHQRKIFLYISPRGRVEGCVLAEVISQARRIIPDSASVECEQEPVRAVGGISRIWVAPEARRSGVASQMVQVVCHQLAYGFHIAQDQLAFTQPTGAGRALAEQVLGRPDFLVYDEERDL